MAKTTNVCLKCLKQNVCKYPETLNAIVSAVNDLSYDISGGEHTPQKVSSFDWVGVEIICKEFVEYKIDIINTHK